jgi:uncharacterized protein (DUF697 family)/GTPase SAR1 family protein
MFQKANEKRHMVAELLQNFDWDESREGVTRESRSRIFIVGLPGAGKSTLLNRLCGWTVSESGADNLDSTEEPFEDFGLFCLATLPENDNDGPGNGFEAISPYGYIGGNYDPIPYPDDLSSPVSADPLAMAEAADLVVYMLDGAVGARAADYRWVGRLRRLGLPLLVVLNKCDLFETDLAARQAEIEKRLAAITLPISALTGLNLPEALVAKMMSICPKLAVPLGRELPDFRRKAARRMIHQTAIFNGLISLQPVPILDLPIQMMTLTSLLFRLTALYHNPPVHARRREVMAALAGTLAARYAVQQLIKLAPVVGWFISGVIGWMATWTIGQGVLSYFEAGGDDRIEQSWQRTKNKAGQIVQSGRRCWQRRPRLRVRIERNQETTEF